MAGDIDKAVQVIGELLNDGETAGKISEIMNAIGEESNQIIPALGGDMMNKMKGIYDTFNNDGDHRIVLLTALRPYMSKKRSDKIDSAIKMMQLFKVVNVMGGDIKKLF